MGTLARHVSIMEDEPKASTLVLAPIGPQCWRNVSRFTSKSNRSSRNSLKKHIVCSQS